MALVDEKTNESVKQNTEARGKKEYFNSMNK